MHNVLQHHTVVISFLLLYGILENTLEEQTVQTSAPLCILVENP